MAEIIKLQNIQKKHREDKEEQLVEEYVCSNCRHLVEATDTACWQCGEKLEPSGEIEHYHKGVKLSVAQFKKELEGITR